MSNAKSTDSPSSLSQKDGDKCAARPTPQISTAAPTTEQPRPPQDTNVKPPDKDNDEDVEVLEEGDEDSVSNLRPLEELISPLGTVTPQLMNSFYRFHTAVYNNQGGRPSSKSRDRLNDFRFSLKYLWGEGGASIATYLENVHDIVVDADFLERSLKKGRNVAALVSKLKDSISRCADSAHNLEGSCEAVLRKWPECQKLINITSNRLPTAAYNREVAEYPSTSPNSDGYHAPFVSAVKGVFGRLYYGAESYDREVAIDDDRYQQKSRSKHDKRYDSSHGGIQNRSPEQTTYYKDDDRGSRRSHREKGGSGEFQTNPKAPSSGPSRQSTTDNWEETMLDAAHPNGLAESEQIPVLLLQLQNHLAENATYWKVHKTSLATYLAKLGSSKNVPPLGLPDGAEIAAILPKVLSEVKTAAQMLLEPIID